MKGGSKKFKEIFLKKDNMIICILLGVLLLIIVWPVENNKEAEQKYNIWDSKEGKISYQEGQKEEKMGMKDDIIMEEDIINEMSNYEGNLEKRLESLLYSMEGVGEVEVMITLSTLGEKVLEKDIPVRRNVVTESDSQGGSRNTNDMDSQEQTVYITDSEGNKLPYVKKEITPVVEGVTVVCQGAGSAYVQKNISEAIQALFSIEAHKIKVVKMKSS